MSYSAKTILYVDDDPDDREFLTDAFKEINSEIDVIVAENGQKALDYLNNISNKEVELPCLIILDLNMPFLDGRETFNQIKKNPLLQNIPIYIFSSSQNPNDKMLFNNLGIEFITKPNNLNYMNEIANQMLVSCH